MRLEKTMTMEKTDSTKETKEYTASTEVETSPSTEKPDLKKELRLPPVLEPPVIRKDEEKIIESKVN